MKVGDTLRHGTYTSDAELRGSGVFRRFAGREERTGRRVQVTDVRSPSRSVPELRRILSYRVEGVAPCLYVGPVDGDHRSTRVALVEAFPPGTALLDVGRPFTSDEALGISRRIARTIAAASRSNVVLGGIGPEFVYVNLESPYRIETVPRAPMLLSTDTARVLTESFVRPPFESLAPFVDPMMLDLTNATTATDVYCWGLLTAWLFTGTHPFRRAAIANQDWLGSMRDDERDPFAGRPAIGAILDHVLLADETQRMPVDELVRELDAVQLRDVT